MYYVIVNVTQDMGAMGSSPPLSNYQLTINSYKQILDKCFFFIPVVLDFNRRSCISYFYPILQKYFLRTIQSRSILCT